MTAYYARPPPSRKPQKGWANLACWQLSSAVSPCLQTRRNESAQNPNRAPDLDLPFSLSALECGAASPQRNPNRGAGRKFSKHVSAKPALRRRPGTRFNFDPLNNGCRDALPRGAARLRTLPAARLSIFTSEPAVAAAPGASVAPAGCMCA